MEQDASLKVFVVNEDPFCLNIYEQHLRNLGYEDVDGFTNGMTCINNLQQQPDIIFVDYGTDILRDIALLKNIKRLNPDIYVVFTCSHEDVETVVHSLKHGAFDYIVKGNYEERRLARLLKKIQQTMTLLKTRKKSLA